MYYLADESGQGLIEYALILVFVAVVVIVALAAWGTQLGVIYSTITDCVPPTAPCPML